jgi:hypothetical protein
MMNKIEQQTNRARWEEHVRAWSRSGLTQSEYSREHGLLPKTFSGWVGRVKKASAQPPEALTVVPVVVKGFGSRAGSTSPIHLQHHSGWQLQLPANVPAVWLGTVLKELT